MKKIFYLMSLCALAFVSCQKEEMADNKPVDGKYTYTFTVSHAAESKATVGDKTGTQWPVLWSEGDQLGVYGEGEFLGVAAIDAASAGKNTGTFTLTTDAELSEGDELYFSYPYVEGAEMKTGKVAAEHTLTASGIGANGVAYAYVDYAGANTEFTLTHLNAYLKFNLLSSEDEDAFAGYDLQGVTLWAAGAELSGDVEVGNGDAVTYKGTGDYVKTTLAAPVKMGTTAQSVFLSALPCDLSAKTVYAIVHMTKGKETVTLPVLLKGAGNLPAGSVTDVTLPSLTKSLAPAWYEPVETRYIAAYGKGWSYGPENTVLLTKSNEPQTVEFKARGNFMKVVEPKSVKVAYASNISNKTSGVVYINRSDSYKDGAFQSFALNDQYAALVAVKNYYNVNSKPGGHVSGLFVLDKDGNTIWGTNVWLSINEFKEVNYRDEQILTKNLGADFSYDENNHWTCCGAYFSWGRPFAIGWDNAGRPVQKGVDVTEANDLAFSAANPYTVYCYAIDDDEPYDWLWGDGNSKNRSGDIDDLWGNANGVDKKGEKSIYDPCPDGYRVVCPSIFEGLSDLYESNTQNTDVAVHYVLHEGLSWGYAGSFTGSVDSNGNPGKLNNGTNTNLAYWSNSNNGSNGYALWRYKSTTTGWGSANARAKGQAFPIRCMVDKEER